MRQIIRFNRKVHTGESWGVIRWVMYYAYFSVLESTIFMLQTEYEKHQEPRNQVPEKVLESEGRPGQNIIEYEKHKTITVLRV